MNSLTPSTYPLQHMAAGLAALVVLGCNGASGAATPVPASPSVSTNVPLEVVKVPVSVFVWNYKDPAVGVDPFYPESTRLKPAPVVPVTVKTTQTNKETSNVTTQVVTLPPAKEIPLSLTGVMGSRLAIINGQTFINGESGMVTLPDGSKVRVKVEEVKSKSVKLTIFVDDTRTEKKEVFLKEQ